MQVTLMLLKPSPLEKRIKEVYSSVTKLIISAPIYTLQLSAKNPQCRALCGTPFEHGLKPGGLSRIQKEKDATGATHPLI